MTAVKSHSVPSFRNYLLLPCQKSWNLLEQIYNANHSKVWAPMVSFHPAHKIQGGSIFASKSHTYTPSPPELPTSRDCKCMKTSRTSMPFSTDNTVVKAEMITLTVISSKSFTPLQNLQQTASISHPTAAISGQRGLLRLTFFEASLTRFCEVIFHLWATDLW